MVLCCKLNSGGFVLQWPLHSLPAYFSSMCKSEWMRCQERVVSLGLWKGKLKYQHKKICIVQVFSNFPHLVFLHFYLVFGLLNHISDTFHTIIWKKRGGVYFMTRSFSEGLSYMIAISAYLMIFYLKWYNLLSELFSIYKMVWTASLQGLSWNTLPAYAILKSGNLQWI